MDRVLQSSRAKNYAMIVTRLIDDDTYYMVLAQDHKTVMIYTTSSSTARYYETWAQMRRPPEEITYFERKIDRIRSRQLRR